MNRVGPHTALQYLKHLNNDVQRYDAWLRSMICAVVDGAGGAAEICLPAQGYDFGAWFYGEEGTSLRNMGGYAKVAKSYNALQGMADDVRAQLCAGERIGSEEISVLVDQANVFRKYVYALETEVREHLCALDPLTGVYNRQIMMQRLQSEQQRVLRHGHRCAIVLMDIDYFKNINDHYGHGVGDDALRESVGIVARALRDYDSIFRFGGEEFLICFPYLDLKRARIAAERLRNKLRSQAIAVASGVQLQLTASFGATLLDADNSLEVSIARADQALYAAKNAGRDRVEIWEE